MVGEGWWERAAELGATAAGAAPGIAQLQVVDTQEAVVSQGFVIIIIIVLVVVIAASV